MTKKSKKKKNKKKKQQHKYDTYLNWGPFHPVLGNVVHEKQ